jgi:hypothetical protein
VKSEIVAAERVHENQHDGGPRRGRRERPVLDLRFSPSDVYVFYPCAYGFGMRGLGAEGEGDFLPSPGGQVQASGLEASSASCADDFFINREALALVIQPNGERDASAAYLFRGEDSDRKIEERLFGKRYAEPELGGKSGGERTATAHGIDRLTHGREVDERDRLLAAPGEDEGKEQPNDDGRAAHGPTSYRRCSPFLLE